MSSWMEADDKIRRERILTQRAERERSLNNQPPRRQNVFISFDFDYDQDIKNALMKQSRYSESPYDFTDSSLKQVSDEATWKADARRRIQRSGTVIILCGRSTHTAKSVSAELNIARQLKKPYFLLAGFPDQTSTKPESALPTDKIYTWNWPNVKALLAGAR